MSALQILQANSTALKSAFTSVYPLGVTYNEVWYAGSVSSTSIAATSAWSAFISTGLAIRVAQYSVSALLLEALPMANQAPVSYVCSDPSSAKLLLYTLIGQSSGFYQLACNDHTWTINTCSSVNMLCVDCSDPCSVKCAAHNVINPSVSACQPTYQGVTMLGVAFYSAPAPTLSLSGSQPQQFVKSTEVILKFNLTEKAIVYCQPYASGSVPSTEAELSTFSFLASTDSFRGATVRVTGMIPLVAYDIYCFTQGFQNNKMALSDMLADVNNPISVVTECCKTVTATLGLMTVTIGGSASSAVSLALDYLPTVNVVAVVTVHAGDQVAYSLYPAKVEFTSSDVSKLATFSIPSSAVGTIGNVSKTLTIALQGTSSTEYAVVFANNVNSFQVLGLDQSPPAPKLLSAVFSSSGSKLYLTMDSAATIVPTLASSFNCSLLFLFGGSSVSTCVQSGTAQFTALLSSAATVVPLELVRFIPGVHVTVTAVCSSLVTSCKASGPNSKNAAAPANPSIPSVTALSPAVVSIATCTQFFIDASTSTGSGGRAWSTPSVTASSANGNATALNIALKSYALSTPTALFSNQIPRGTYVFVVTLCNFLGACGVGSTTTAVIDSGVIPYTTVYGQSARTTSRPTPFRLTYDSYITNCDGSQSRSNLVPSLTITATDALGSSSTVSFSSMQKQPGAYSLPAFVLVPNYLYTFVLSITYSQSSLPPQPVTTYVSVVASSLVATISGGSTQGVRIGYVASVDGSRSYDPDQQNSRGSQVQGIIFAFSCFQVAPTFSSDCSFVPQRSSASDQARYLASDTVSTETSSQIMLTVSDPTRSSSASIVLQALAPIAPLASLSVANNGPTKVISPNALSLSLNVNYMLNTVIKLTCTGVDLSQYSTQSTSVNVTAGSRTAAQAYQNTYVIPPNTLPEGVTLVFTLSAFSPASPSSSVPLSSSSTLSVVVNLPPQPGSFQVSPATGGTASVTTFTFSASSFSSDSLPLSYSFGFYTGQSLLRLSSYSQQATMYAVLPAGSDSLNYMVTTSCYVQDVLTSLTEVTAVVEVLVNTDSAAALNALNTLLASGNTNQAIANGAASLNQASCANAPNCNSLHREGCSNVANTCGPCKSGFIGSTGAGNSACVRGATSSAHFQGVSVCASTDDCEAFYTCVNRSCTLQPKDCLNGCSSHGTCEYQDVNFLSAAALATCMANDPLCLAICRCDDGYASADCSLTDADYLSLLQQREMLIQVVWSSTKEEDKTAANVVSWISTLTSLSQSGLDDLSITTLDAFYNMVNYILEVSIELDLYYTYGDDVLALLDIGAGVSTSSGTRRGRRQLAVYETSSNNVWFGMQQYIQFVMNSLTAGFSFSTYLDRVSITFTAMSEASAEISLLSPVSTFDALYGGVVPQSIDVRIPSNSTLAKFAVIAWRAATYDTDTFASFLANPVSVVMDDVSVCYGDDGISSGCEVVYGFVNFDEESYSGSTTTSFTTQCKRRHKTTTTYDCPRDLTVTAVCSGDFDGEIVSTCPYYSIEPLCSRLNLLGSFNESWTSWDYSNTSTVCNTTLFSLSSYDALVNESVGSVDMVPVLSSSLITPKEIVYDFTHHGIEAGLIVMAIVLTIAVVIIGPLLWKYLFKPASSPKEDTMNPLYFDGANIDLVAFDPENEEVDVVEEEMDTEEDGDEDALNALTISRLKRISTQASTLLNMDDDIPAPVDDTRIQSVRMSWREPRPFYGSPVGDNSELNLWDSSDHSNPQAHIQQAQDSGDDDDDANDDSLVIRDASVFKQTK
jgi:hypothetical protein